MDFAPRDADLTQTILGCRRIPYIVLIFPFHTTATSRTDGRTDQTKRKTGLPGVNPLPCSTRVIPSEQLQSPTEQHGETPRLIFFLYEWLTCVCKVLYLTKGKRRETSGEGYSSLFASFWLTRGLGRYLYPAQALR